jgi:hypothetical protein
MKTTIKTIVLYRSDFTDMDIFNSILKDNGISEMFIEFTDEVTLKIVVKVENN